jgi:hypothetical protein
MENILPNPVEIQNAPIRGPISATKSGSKLMRQISALGMEDPIFCTTEDVPNHPSNVFDDMGFDDIPSDMIDLMSLVSDPTAVPGDEHFKSLLHVNFKHIDCLRNALSVIDQEESSPLIIAGTRNSICVPRGFAILRDTSATTSSPKRNIGITHSHSAARRVKENQCSQQQSMQGSGIAKFSEVLSNNKTLQNKNDTSNTSIPSLEVHGVFSRSQRNVDSETNNSSNCAMNDPLLAEAALALKNLGCGLYFNEMAKNQHSFTVESNVKQKENAKIASSMARERRVLPTLSGIFPS